MYWQCLKDKKKLPERRYPRTPKWSSTGARPASAPVCARSDLGADVQVWGRGRRPANGSLHSSSRPPSASALLLMPPSPSVAAHDVPYLQRIEDGEVKRNLDGLKRERLVQKDLASLPLTLEDPSPMDLLRQGRKGSAVRGRPQSASAVFASLSGATAASRDPKAKAKAERRAADHLRELRQGFESHLTLNAVADERSETCTPDSPVANGVSPHGRGRHLRPKRTVVGT